MRRSLDTGRAPSGAAGVCDDHHVLTDSEANRLLYADTADEYELDVARSYEKFATKTRDVIALAERTDNLLDACGGTGGVSTVLIELGLKPVTVDVSAEMLAIYRRKAEAMGHSPEIHLGDVREFLVTDERLWDVVFLASALHHFEDYRALLRLVADRIAAGGLIATFHDPTRMTAAGRRLRLGDYYLRVVRQDPRAVPAKVGRRLRARRSGPELENYGRLDERHAVTGIDDLALVDDLVEWGFTIERHDRIHDMNHRAFEWVSRLLRQPTAFNLVVRKQ